MRGAEAAEVVYTDDIWVGYRYFSTKDIQTAYPFGYGLSYTQFQYTDLHLSGQTFRDELTVSVKVTNVGKTAGKEAVQVYLSAPGQSMPKPAMELKAFGKTGLLAPDESERLTFTIHLMDLASFDSATASWIAEQGVYEIHIGASSLNMRGALSFQLPEERIVERVSKALIPERGI